MTLFHIHYGDDLIEVALRGYIIARITIYGPTCHRKDIQFDDLPTEVKDKILSKVADILEKGE